MFNLNPIDVLKQRELTTLPPHFVKVQISEGELIDSNLTNWIKTKLKGRYSVIRLPISGETGGIKSRTFAAFEDHKELTYFMLACPYLRRN